MIVVNETNGTTIAAHAEVATSFWSRGVGLIGRRSLPDGYALVIRPCSSIHMFSMSIPLDVLYVDKRGEVVRVLASIKPWCVGPIIPRSAWVVELPAGTAARTATTRGDCIALHDDSYTASV